jgi:hypothetical protein
VEDENDALLYAVLNAAAGQESLGSGTDGDAAFPAPRDQGLSRGAGSGASTAGDRAAADLAAVVSVRAMLGIAGWSWAVLLVCY